MAGFQIGPDNLTGTSYTHTGLPAGTTYYYSIRAISGSGEASAWSEPIPATVTDTQSSTSTPTPTPDPSTTPTATPTATPTTTPPALPAPGLTAQPTAGAVDLSWDAVTGAVRYELWVWTEADDWQDIGGNNLTGTTFRHNRLAAGTTFHYAVRAVNAAGDVSPWSPFVPATVTVAQPDASSLIVFNSNRGGNYDIYVMNDDGSNVTRLTDHPDWDNDPAWSPDGNRIAFDSIRDGNFEIYAMNADGTGPVNLTNHPSGDESPSWSPDGKRIAFKSYRDGNSEIYVMNADGTSPIRLTDDPEWDGAPAWSPDSSKIAFVSYRQGTMTST